MKKWSKLKVFGLIWILLSGTPAIAHERHFPLIVDTDMALDDIRAITMLLNSNTGDILLFAVSDGIRPPEEGVRNLTGLLKAFDKPHVRVAGGKTSTQPEPSCRRQIPRLRVPGDTDVNDTVPAASETIVQALTSAKDPVVYLCMGPLTNLADAIRLSPVIKEKISLVLYYGSAPDQDQPGWNTLRDIDSAGEVFASGVSIYGANPPEQTWISFDSQLLEQIIQLDTPAAEIIEKVHDAPEIKKRMEEKHLYIQDELLVLYMNDPTLFSFEKTSGQEKIRFLARYRQNEIKDFYLQHFGNAADMHLSPREAVVLNRFPDDPALFRADLSPHVNDMIRKYGVEEWKACVLTNELHRHLGMYSIIGAKMGVRAREILQAPFDTLEVNSFAGTKPPLSCLNDGLQVSTGASLGRGAIRISDTRYLPAAEFTFKDTRLTLTLKPEIREKVEGEIRALVKEYGGTTPEYFSRVRQLSITQWEALDREAIFDESMILIRPAEGR